MSDQTIIVAALEQRISKLEALLTKAFGKIGDLQKKVEKLDRASK